MIKNGHCLSRCFLAPAFWLLLAILSFSTIRPGTASAAGLLKSTGGDDSNVRILSHNVDVVINNSFAQTVVDQIFVNDADYDLEAVYTFPLPKQASLSELSLWVGETEMIGEVVEKEKARKIYEQQKAQGNDTAMAEKNSYKTFDVSVGRVPAGSETRIRLVYYQPMEIDLNVGRYLYPLAEGNVDEERIAFWSVDDTVSGAFNFHLVMKSAFPVADVRVPGFQDSAVIEQILDETEDGESESNTYEVTLASREGANLSRDIIFYYRLDDTVPARVEMIPFRDNPNEPGTFMVVVTPAADLQPISEGGDWTFVLDISGSMGGHKIATLVDGVTKVIGKMKANDRFRIITFNNSSDDLTGGFVNATQENVQQWLQHLRNIHAGGGTDLYDGLKKACQRLDDDRTTSIVLVTDGVANVGETKQKAFLNLLRTYDIRLFTFVIGNSANQPLLERLTQDSGGFALNISDSDDIVGRIMQAKAKALHECMHGVQLSFSGERVKDLTPTSLGNLYIGQQLVMFGRYPDSGEAQLILKAKISGQERTWKTMVELPETARDNPELERLWALSAIEDVMREIRENGESEKLRKQVVDLGLEYSLVTDFTSMLVVNDDILEDEDIQKKNARRIQAEKQAQAAKSSKPAKNYRVDNRSGNGGMFKGKSSPGIGSGPVGPLFVGLIAWLNRRKRKVQGLSWK